MVQGGSLTIDVCPPTTSTHCTVYTVRRLFSLVYVYQNLVLLFDDSVLISPPFSSLRTANAVLPTTFGMFQAEQKEGQLLGATVYSNGVNVVVSHAHNENLKQPGIPSPPLPPLPPPPSPSSSSTPNFRVFHSLLPPLFLIHLLPPRPPSTSSSTFFLLVHLLPPRPPFTSSSTFYLLVHLLPPRPPSTSSSTFYLLVHLLPPHPPSTSSSTFYLLIHLLPPRPPSTSSCLPPRPVPQPGLPLASMTQLSPAATVSSAQPMPCHEDVATGPTEI